MARHRKARAALLLAGAAATTTTASIVVEAPASDAVWCPIDHCYGLAVWNDNPYQFTGISANLRTNCMYLSSWNYFDTNEMWLTSLHGGYWVEAGITVGEVPTGGYYSTPVHFWADKRPYGGYNEHYYGGYGYNSVEPFSITSGGQPAGQWKVNMNGTVAYSTNNYGPVGYNAQTGSETIDQNALVYGSSQQMSWLDANGVGHSGWYPSLFANGAGYSFWNTPGSWVVDGHNTTC